MAFYRLTAAAKLVELAENGPVADVERRYRERAETLVREYPPADRS